MESDLSRRIKLSGIRKKTTILATTIALILSTSCCWLPALAIALGGGSTIWGIHNGAGHIGTVLSMAGLGLLLFGLYRIWKNKQPNPLVLISRIRCPECGFEKNETMPTDACQFFYECSSCHTLLRPQTGDCCVYCSYGTVKCPPMQSGKDCC